MLGEAAQKTGIPDGAITFIDRPDREVVLALLKSDQFIDLIIPLGAMPLMKIAFRRSVRRPGVNHRRAAARVRQ